MRSGRSWPSSRRERANLRARRRLEEAPSSPCPHCGRETKTVDGMCADCWGVKDAARAKRWLRQRSETDPLFDFDELLSAENLLWAVGVLVFLVLGVIWGLTEWI